MKPALSDTSLGAVLRPVLLPATVALALLLGGCSGGEEPETAGPVATETTGSGNTTGGDAGQPSAGTPTGAAIDSDNSKPTDTVDPDADTQVADDGALGDAAEGTDIDPATVTVTTSKVTFTNSAGLELNNNTLFMPDQFVKTRGAVIMMHGCAGPGSSLYTRWGQALGSLGYMVLLVDSFGPRKSSSECGNGSAGISEVDDRPKDALAAYDFLVNEHQAGRVVLMGWSHGASSVLATLWQGQARQPFRAGFVFYAGCGLWNKIAEPFPYAPLWMHHGDADTTTGLASCVTLDTKEATKGAGRIVLTTYAGAGHSFDNALKKEANGVVSYGTADSRTLNESDWNAKLAADADVLKQIALQLSDK
jgi:dienelactone hydrolase